ERHVPVLLRRREVAGHRRRDHGIAEGSPTPGELEERVDDPGTAAVEREDRGRLALGGPQGARAVLERPAERALAADERAIARGGDVVPDQREPGARDVRAEALAGRGHAPRRETRAAARSRVRAQ